MPRFWFALPCLAPCRLLWGRLAGACGWCWCVDNPGGRHTGAEVSVSACRWSGRSTRRGSGLGVLCRVLCLLFWGSTCRGLVLVYSFACCVGRAEGRHSAGLRLGGLACRAPRMSTCRSLVWCRPVDGPGGRHTEGRVLAGCVGRRIGALCRSLVWCWCIDGRGGRHAEAWVLARRVGCSVGRHAEAWSARVECCVGRPEGDTRVVRPGGRHAGAGGVACGVSTASAVDMPRLWSGTAMPLLCRPLWRSTCGRVWVSSSGVSCAWFGIRMSTARDAA